MRGKDRSGKLKVRIIFLSVSGFVQKYKVTMSVHYHKSVRIFR